MNRKTSFLILFLIFMGIVVSVAPLYAGGPLNVWHGVAVRWSPANTITYKVDPGKFGIYTPAQVRAVIDSSFAAWANVSTSTVGFQHTAGDTLPQDVNKFNFLQYTTYTDFKYDGLNPIMLDDDGAITDSLFGIGASDGIIGFAGAGDSNNDGLYDDGESVMNGKFAGNGSVTFTLDEWKSTFVHEFGHFLGLDHTQINGNFVSDASKTIYIPTMYPTATANDVPLGDLNPDDIAAISDLYPEPAFSSLTGKISGTVTRFDGGVVRGANIIAISTGSDSLMNRVSTITDYYIQDIGSYTIVGLQPGEYVVRLEPVDQNFTGGSGVGPYSFDLTDLSFVNPVLPEYYNGANESSNGATDAPEDRVPVTVSAGGTTGNIDIIANKPNAVLYLVDDFSSTAGTLLTAAGWSAHSGTGTNPVATANPGLTYSGYAGSSIGNAALVNDLGGEDVNRLIPALQTNGSSVYYTALVNVTEPATSKTGDYFLHLGYRVSPTDFTQFCARLFARVVSGSVNFGLSNTSTPTYGPTSFARNTTYLIIVKYTINTGGNDATSLWVYPSGIPGSESGAGIPEVSNSSTQGQDVLNAVGIRQGAATTSPQVVLDGLRVSSDWPSGVSAVAEHQTNLIPAGPLLEQNYPNPFNPVTIIRYQLSVGGIVTLRVFNLLGQEVAHLAEGFHNKGSYQVEFDGRGLPSGAYFYQLNAGSTAMARRMLLLK